MKDAIGKAGRLTASGLGEAVEASGRALTRRAAESAVAAPRPVPDEKSLARALSVRPGPPLVGRTATAALATRVAARFGPMKFLARKTPLWIVATVGPALYESVARGADDVGIVASHLAHRVRAAGQQPDPERVWRASVQLVAGVPVDTGADPRHGPLLLSWLKRAVPFGARVVERDPASLAAAAANLHTAVVARADQVD